MLCVEENGYLFTKLLPFPPEVDYMCITVDYDHNENSGQWHRSRSDYVISRPAP